MANDDGAMEWDGAGGDLPHPPMHEPPGVTEPSVLDKDVPWPARWERVLGPGGEDLGDGLVPVGGEGPPSARATSGRGSKGRRRPRASTATRDPRSTSPPRSRRTIRHSDPGALLGAGVAAGLAGLATLLVVVLFSFDGSPPADRDSGNVAALNAPAVVGSSVAEWTAPSARVEARVRESAERRREVAREKQEQARRREREREAPPTLSNPETTQVAAPSRPAAPAEPAAPATDPWPGVSAAEREFTPGPWNLN
jgi:hypothetical protein